MAFMKTADAIVKNPSIHLREWEEVRQEATSEVFGSRQASVNLSEFSPAKYLLTHCTIIASVDVDEVSNVKTGSSVTEGNRTIKRLWNDYYITPETSKFINQNGDSWDRQTLLNTYRTFIGAENYVEHVQIPELSKGKIIDAVARDLGDTVYIDILVATDRKHASLIQDIESGKMNAMSMGCSIQFSRCSKCGNVAADDTELCEHVRYEKGNTFVDESGKKRIVAELCFPEDTRVTLASGKRVSIASVQEGDLVLTHEGTVKPVVKTYERPFKGDLVSVSVMGMTEDFKSTPNHPYFALKPRKTCACGCEGVLSGFRSYSKHEYFRSFLPGHNNFSNSPENNVPSFYEAGELEVGDILMLPVPKGNVIERSLNPNRAELLGWFLAEGSYLKSEGKHKGVQFTLNAVDEYDVAERISELLAEEFPSVPAKNKTTQWSVLEALQEDSLTTKELSKSLGLTRVSASLALRRLKAKGLVSSRKMYDSGEKKARNASSMNVLVWSLVEFPREDYLVSPKVYCYDRSSEDGQKLVVHYNNLDAAKWFLKFAGEYCESKKLPSRSLYWDEDLQAALLKAYVKGDGTVDALERHHVSSASVELIDQMQMIAARCGLWTRRQIIHSGKKASLRDFKPGDRGTQYGHLPRHVLCFQPSEETTRFFGMVQDPKVWTREPSWRKETFGDTDYLLYKIKDVRKEEFEGSVYNFGVQGTNSYLVEGLSVHNCGHSSDPDSVTFIEASWVANPAFKGAVMRTVLNPTVNEDGSVVMKESSPYAALFESSPLLQEFMTAQNIDKYLHTASVDREKAFGQLQSEMRQVFASQAPKIAFGFGDDDDEGGDEEDKNFVEEMREEIKDDLTKDIKRKIRQEVKEEMDLGQKKPEFKGEPEGESLNDTVVKSYQVFSSRYASELPGPDALRQVFLVLQAAKHKGWDSVKHSSSYGNREILAAHRIKNRDFSTEKYSPTVYACLSKVGGTRNYTNLKAFLNACELASGRPFSRKEARQLVLLGKVLK